MQQFQESLQALDGRFETQTFGAGYRNLLGELEGSDPQRKQEFVLDRCPLRSRRLRLSAATAWDPIGYIHNGADDNASGTAAVLEILDALSRSGASPGTLDPVRPLGRRRKRPARSRSTGSTNPQCRCSRSSWWLIWTWWGDCVIIVSKSTERGP